MRLLIATGETPDQTSIMGLLIYVVFMSLQINLALAIFNILPIAPLDGSKILSGLLPDGFGKMFHIMERYGPFILLGLIIFGRATGVSVLGGNHLAVREIFQQHLCGNLSALVAELLHYFISNRLLLNLSPLL